MAAKDLFEKYLAELPPGQLDRQRKLIAEYRADLLASRSEEARVRCVNEFMHAMVATEAVAGSR